MNQPSYDEYEEVESPFAKKTAEKSAPRERLRTRKNVFNRPFATSPSVAPAVFETTSTRRSIGHPDFTDMVEHRRGELHDAQIDYLEEEEVVEKRPARTASATKKAPKTKKNILAKIGWAVIGLLVLRLIFMDRGVWDYFATEGDIRVKQEELQSIRNENDSLKAEISRIHLDKNYQRQLAKEHLGVIAVDEFLILFAGESAETSTQDDRLL
jgi:cell division protein FtsB